MRFFRLNRTKDISGISGVGVVAYGVEYDSGKVCLTWRSEKAAIEILDSISIVEVLHGHEGATIVEIFDPKKHGRYYKNLIDFMNGADIKKESRNEENKA